MNRTLADPAFWSRCQFGFTVTYHYLFPQLTMGLAWFLVYWEWRGLRTYFVFISRRYAGRVSIYRDNQVFC
jgi:hypothetical protein